MKPAHELTDRAKRYRAQRNRPAGPRRCNFCTSRRNIDVDHITGDETDGGEENLIYLCRTCNTVKGIVQARNRIGVRTRQFNPSGGFRAFRNAALVLMGIQPGDAAAATAEIRATSPAQRIAYGDRLERENPFVSEAQRRKFFAMARRGDITMRELGKWIRETGSRQLPKRKNAGPPTFAQYAHGVSIHRRGAHDEGGKIIHATPPQLRHRYAKQIARTKAQRRSEVPF